MILQLVDYFTDEAKKDFSFSESLTFNKDGFKDTDIKRRHDLTVEKKYIYSGTKEGTLLVTYVYDTDGTTIIERIVP